MKRSVLLLSLVATILAGAAHAQAYLSWGLSETGKYDTSAFDSIGGEHRMVIHIPIYSLKEKGALPPFSISLVENSPTWEIQTNQYGVQYSSISSNSGSPGLMPTLGYKIGFDSEPVSYLDPNTSYYYTYGWNYLVDPLGGHHEIHPLFGHDTWVAVDGSRYSWLPNQASYSDPAGNIHSSSGISDQHGNTMTAHANGSGSYYTDPLGRNLDDPNSVSPGCFTHQYPAFGGTAPYTFCYTQVTARSSITLADLSYQTMLHQNPQTFISLSSVMTPGGVYSFTYDSWGAVTQIGLPTGGSINYEYQTRSNSACIGNGDSFARVVTKRTMSTGTSATAGQTSSTNYSFETVSVDPQFNCITAENARKVLADGSYTVSPASRAGGSGDQTQYFDHNGLLIKTVVDPVPFAGSVVPPASQPFDSGKTITTTWPDGRVDTTCIAYVFSYTTPPCTSDAISSVSLAWINESEFVGSTTPTSQNFTLIPFGVNLPARKVEFETGLNNTAGAVARRTDSRYYWQDHNAYALAGMFELPSAITVYDGQANAAQASSIVYDESSYSSGGVKGSPTTVSSGDISAHTFYNSSGLVTGQIDGRGKNASITDSFQCSDAFPHVVRNALNQQSTINYDCSSGLVSSVISPNSTTTFVYDGVNNLTSTTNPDGGSISIDYHGYSLPLQVTTTTTADPDPARVSTDSYDGLGRAVNHSITSADGTIMQTTDYDGMGRVQSQSLPFVGASASGYETAAYDALGRVIKTTHADGSARYTCYDGVASASEPNCTNGIPNAVASAYHWQDVTDENGLHSRHSSDSLGRLRQVKEPDPTSGALSLRTDYGYDVLGNLSQVAQYGSGSSIQRLRTFTYDTHSRLITASNPESGLTCYGSWNGGACQNGYDADGNLLHKTDASNKIVDYFYDDGNRLVAKQYSDHTPSDCLRYDTSTNGIGLLALQWTQTGLCSAAMPSSALTSRAFLQYDLMGRLKEEQQCVLTLCTANSVLTFDYDLAGSPTRYSVPTVQGSQSVAIGYNQAGWPAQLNRSVGGNSNPTQLLSVSSFGLTGAVASATVGNSLNFTRTFDVNLKVVGVKVKTQ